MCDYLEYGQDQKECGRGDGLGCRFKIRYKKMVASILGCLLKLSHLLCGKELMSPVNQQSREWAWKEILLFKLWDDCSPSWHFDYNLVRHPKKKYSARLHPDPHKLWDNKCLFEETKFWNNLLHSNSYLIYIYMNPSVFNLCTIL